MKKLLLTLSLSLVNYGASAQTPTLIDNILMPGGELSGNTLVSPYGIAQALTFLTLAGEEEASALAPLLTQLEASVPLPQLEEVDTFRQINMFGAKPHLSLNEEVSQSAMNGLANFEQLTIPDNQEPFAVWLDQENARLRDFTNGLIDRPLAFDFSIAWFFANALYFRDDWAQQFTADDTYFDTFDSLGATSPRHIYMMRNPAAELRLIDLPDLEAGHAFTIPYADDAYMAILLPEKSMSEDQQERHEFYLEWLHERSIHDFAALEGLRSDTPTQLVDLRMPKWDVASEIDILSAIPASHQSALDIDEDLMSPAVPISLFYQKARIKVDEEGTEAAAITVMGGIESDFGGALQPNQIIEMDRPFLYAIMQPGLSTPLFMGFVSLPTELSEEEKALVSESQSVAGALDQPN